MSALLTASYRIQSQRASALRWGRQTGFLGRGTAVPELREFIMANWKITTSALLGISMGLMSCAIPKATVVSPPPVTQKVTKAQETNVEELLVPTLPGDEIRMPADMVGLPTDDEFRSTTPVMPRADPGAGSVFVRPPTDPPSRVKSKPTE